MAYTRKYIRGRALSFGEVADRLAADPKAMFYHRLWNKPVPAGFIQNWQVRKLREYALRSWICEADLNPNYFTKEDHNG